MALPHTVPSNTSFASVSSLVDADDDDDGGNGAKKTRFVWSPEVHACFCEAVHQLGVDKAKPQAIAQLMQNDATLAGHDGMGMPTRQNIKSHLQKYRLLLAKRGEQSDRRYPPGGYHEMPSHANRNAQRQAGGRHFSMPPQRSQQHHSSSAPSAVDVQALDSASVDAFSAAMTDDNDDAAAFAGALGLPASLDLADIAASTSGFDFAALGGAMNPAPNPAPMHNPSLPTSSAMHGHFGDLQMSHLAHLNPTSGAVSAGARSTALGDRVSALQRGMLSAHGLSSASAMEAPHAAYQLDQGGLRKRRRTDDALGAGLSAGLSSGLPQGLTQGLTQSHNLAQSDNSPLQGDTLAQDVYALGSDDGHGVLSAGLSGLLGSSLDGGSLDGGSLGNGSDAGHDGRASDGGNEENGSVGQDSVNSREDQPPPDWFT